MWITRLLTLNVGNMYKNIYKRDYLRRDETLDYMYKHGYLPLYIQLRILFTIIHCAARHFELQQETE